MGEKRLGGIHKMQGACKSCVKECGECPRWMYEISKEEMYKNYLKSISLDNHLKTALVYLIVVFSTKMKLNNQMHFHQSMIVYYFV